MAADKAEREVGERDTEKKKGIGGGRKNGVKKYWKVR